MKPGFKYKSDNADNTKKITADNFNAVKSITETYGFAQLSILKMCVLNRLWDSIRVNCRDGYIHIIVSMTNPINIKYRTEVSVILLKLNRKYHLNLGLNDKSGEITANRTIFTANSAVSTECFEENLLELVDCFDEHYREITDELEDYIVRDFLMSDCELIAKHSRDLMSCDDDDDEEDDDDDDDDDDGTFVDGFEGRRPETLDDDEFRELLDLLDEI